MPIPAMCWSSVGSHPPSVYVLMAATLACVALVAVAVYCVVALPYGRLSTHAFTARSALIAAPVSSHASSNAVTCRSMRLSRHFAVRTSCAAPARSMGFAWALH